MASEMFSTKALVVESGKNIKGTLTLYLDR